MRLNKSAPKSPHITSTPILPPAKRQLPNQNSNQQALIQHRKQIQATLNELHRLQSQIYELNVPENPHSSSPVKKQIKQLSYLYENMAKPKAKNGLNVNSTDIQTALRIMNEEWTADMVLQSQLSDQYQKSGNQIQLMRKTKTNLLGNTSTNRNSSFFRTTIKLQNAQSTTDRYYKIPKQKLQQKFQQITHTPISLGFISKNQNNQYINTKQLFQFINFTECQTFDPVQKAYNMFLNQNGDFDLSKYNQFNQILGLPKIKNINTFIAAIYQSQGIIQGKQTTLLPNINSNANTARANKSQQKKQLNLIGKNSTSMTAKITFQQFKRVLDLQL